MKKIGLIIVILMVLFFMVGCSDDSDSSKTSDELISYSCNNLITKGSQMLDDSLSSYSSIDSTQIKKDLKTATGYVLFPFNVETSEDFSKRMKDVFWSEDNIIKTYNLQKNIISENLTNSGKGFLKDAFRKAVLIIGNLTYNAVKSHPVLGTIMNALNVPEFPSINSSGGSDNKVSSQLDQLGLTIVEFLINTRSHLNQLNSKMDESIRYLQDLTGDVNFLVNLQLNTSMRDAINSFDGFMVNYASAATTTDASNIVYDYMVSSSSFSQNILDFIACAKDVHQWALTENKYSDYVHDDTNTFTNIVELGIAGWSSGGGSIDKYQYNNPKKQLIISVGDLDYLIKMILTKLNLNSVLYSGTTLQSKNAVDAQYFLDLINNEGIKQCAVDIVLSFQNNYTTISNTAYSRSYSAGNGINGCEITGDGIKIYTLLPDNQFIVYDNGVEVERYQNGGGNPQETILKYVLDHYNMVFSDYLGLYVTRLASLETILRSYL